jgi:glutamine amidotransferase
MNVAIVKYNAGNVQSVLFALQRLGVNAIVTDDHEQLRSADKVIFPGVGHADSAVQYLRKSGLDQLIISLQQPVLGICLGLQLLCQSSEEGDTKCLGIFDTVVKKFQVDSASTKNEETFKIPHMGWNTITKLSSPLMEGVKEQSYMYFVHGYFAELCSQTAFFLKSPSDNLTHFPSIISIAGIIFMN